MKQRHFAPPRFAILVFDRTGGQVNAMNSSRDQAGSRDLAQSVLRLMPSAAHCELHAYVVDDAGLPTRRIGETIETVHRPDGAAE